MRIRIRDLFEPVSGMEKFGSKIRYKHPGSAILLLSFYFVKIYNSPAIQANFTSKCSSSSMVVYYNENAIKRGVKCLVRQQARSAGGDKRLHDPEPRLRGLSDQHSGLQLPPDDGLTGQKQILASLEAVRTIR
jgi:hypothetical protein